MRLNLLFLHQTYLTSRLQDGENDVLPGLRSVQLEICDWYENEAEKIKTQSKIDDIQDSEKVRIHHHELHKKKIRNSNILKLTTENSIIEGHDKCSNFLQSLLEDLLLHPADLGQFAQQTLLDEIEEVFTDKDNTKLVAPVTKEEVWESIVTSNMKSSPGSDGIPTLVYKEHWDILGDALTEVVQAIFNGHSPTYSQRTSLMIFTNKPKKNTCTKPSSKRRISLLNCDFKVITGVEM